MKPEASRAKSALRNWRMAIHAKIHAKGIKGNLVLAKRSAAKQSAAE
jgi:hypothetical protein